MAIPSRNSGNLHIVSNARTFHITSSTVGKKFLLQSDRAAQLFIQVLYEYRTQNKFRLHGFVVMPNHIHILLTVDAGTSIERAAQSIKGGFAFRAGKELGLKSPIWQRGFSEVRVLDVKTASRIREYIHNNPVTAEMVQEPGSFPYSSLHAGFALDPLPHELLRVSRSAKAMVEDIEEVKYRRLKPDAF